MEGIPNMSITQTITRKLTRSPTDFSDVFKDSKLSEKEAIHEVERLADQYSDIKSDQLVISRKHLFQFKYY